MSVKVKNKVERAIENFADLRDRATDSELNELLDGVVSALEAVEDFLDEIEDEAAEFDHDGTPIAIDRHDNGTYTAEVAGVPTGDPYPTYQAAVDGAIGYAMSLE